MCPFDFDETWQPPETKQATRPTNGGQFVIDRYTVALLVEMSAQAVKLYLWLLARANFTDRDKLKRGQCVASIADMRDALTYHAGFRKIAPTPEQCRSAYEALRQATMITTTKTTRGMIITICNYDKMQEIKKREAHNEIRNENGMKPGGTPHNTERMNNECNLPLYIPAVEWDAFLQMRKQKGKPPTDHATELLLKKLGEMHNKGVDISDVLNKSTINGWLDVFEPKQPQKASRPERKPSYGNDPGTKQFIARA